MAFFIARLCTFSLHNCVLLFCTIHVSSGQRNSYTVPTSKGNKAVTALDGQNDQIIDQEDTEPTASYTITCQFTDDDKSGAIVGAPIVISGTTGSKKDTNLTLPTNYKLAGGQTLPTSVTIGNSNQTIDIHLVHDTLDVIREFKMGDLDLKFTANGGPKDGTVTDNPGGKTFIVISDTGINTMITQTGTEDLVTGKIK